MSSVNGVGVPEPGEIIAGKYRVEKVLGVGGMGVVVAAQHVRLDEKVALKFLLPDALSNPEAVARFEREARAASKIKSEHVARVSDVGTLDNGSPYIVMEYLQGNDLADQVEKHGPMSMEQAVDFVLQASEALADAHALGIVHRDLKPANLFCIQRTDGQLCIKVLDFGISKLTTGDAEAVSMTRTTAILGSPLYMSPEQMMMSKGVDARTDIWSLGTILFELLTGRPPFDADTVTELAIRIAGYPHSPILSLRPDLPPRFEELISKCLAKDREQRFQTVAELAVALGEFAPPHARLSIERVVGTLQRAGMSTALQGAMQPPAAPAPGPPHQGVGPQTSASWGQTGGDVVPPPAKTPVGAIVGGLAFLAVAVGVVAVFLVKGSSDPTPVSGATTTAATSASASAAPAASSPPADSASAPAAPASSAAPPPGTSAPPAAEASSHPAAPTSVPMPAPRGPAPGPAGPTAPAQAHSAAPAAPAGPKVNCNPPYVINAAGEHEYKPECLH
jgi:serine/threonine-protein kinase